MQKIYSYSDTFSIQRTIFLPLLALSKRDLLHYKRDFGRWVGVVAQPIMIWFLIGNGLQNIIPQKINGQMSYSQFFFISNLTLSLVFLVAFSAMSIIQDRKIGLLSIFLQSPVPSFIFALFPIVSMTVCAFIQTMIFVLLGSTLGFRVAEIHFPQILIVSILSCLTIGSLSVALAWTFSSQHAFHAIISLIFLPLWIISGSFFPIQENFISYFSLINPIYYMNHLYRTGFIGNIDWQSTGNLFLMSVISLSISILLISKRRSQQ